MGCLRPSACLLALVFLSPPASAQREFPEGVTIERDVVFGKGGDRDLKMHILRPKETPKAPLPVVVWVHGGGWQGGSRNSGLLSLPAMVRQGYLCASIEYRFSQEAKFPAQIEDCKCAIRFLRAHADEYHLDPQRIGVWGASAGGHLVALLGTAGDVKELEGKGGWQDQSSRVQAVCGWFGPSEFVKLHEESKGAAGPIKGLLGGTPEQKPELAKLAAPLSHVSKEAPPFLLMHGDRDTLVPLSQSEMLHEALKKAGVESTLHVVKGAGHGFGGPEITAAIVAFFDKHLKNGK